MGRVKEVQRKIEKVKTSTNNHEKKNKGLIRIKMPNFDAIHKKQFKRMESISEHVERKAERAKELTKSTVKKSAVKPTTVDTQLNKESTNKTTTVSAGEKSLRNGGVSKARIKIDFNNSKGNQTSIVPSITKKSVTVSEKDKIINISNKENLLNKRKSNISIQKSDKSKSNPEINLKRQKSLRSFDEFENKTQKLSKSQSVTGDDEKNKEPGSIKKIRVNRRFMLQMASLRNSREQM